MGVDKENLQVIDRCRHGTGKLSNNYSSTVCTYLQVAIMVFIIYTISYIFVTASVLSNKADKLGSNRF